MLDSASSMNIQLISFHTLKTLDQAKLTGVFCCLVIEEELVEVCLTFLSLVSFRHLTLPDLFGFVPERVLRDCDKTVGGGSVSMFVDAKSRRGEAYAAAYEGEGGDGGNDDGKIRATNVGVFNLLLIHDGILIPP